MITELYTFSPGAYVVADEWNANFNVLYKTNLAHLEAITDANSTIAFPNSDLSALFASVRGQPNSFYISGNTVILSPECEYYKSLNPGNALVININENMNAESRILVYLPEVRTFLDEFFVINYSGTKNIDFGFYGYEYFRPGYYYIMIYESNGVAQIKLIWTGV